MLDGALTPMLEEGSETEADERYCGFEGLTIESLPDYAEIQMLPDSPAGRTTTIFVDLLADGDAAARLDFASRKVTDEFRGDDPIVLAEGIAGLQETLATYEVTRILEQDDHRLHLLMQGAGVDLLVSIGFDETDPEPLACLSLAT